MVLTVHHCKGWFLLLVLAFITNVRSLDGACSWPSVFASSTWTDSSKGELIFADTTMTGWVLNVENLQLQDWECYISDYFESDGYLVMKTSETFILFHTRNFYGYLCMQFTKITDVSYRYYEMEPPQDNVQNERLYINDIDTTAPTNLTDICLESLGATGSEYKILIKTGHEEEAKIRCPYNFLGTFDYEHTTSSGTVTCQGQDTMSLCTDNKEITFSYDTCPTKIAYSESDTVWCVDSVPVGDSNYVTVYNGLDANVDDANTFRFSCFGVSSNSRNASVTPQNCKKDQTPYTVPTDNSGFQTGATMTMPGDQSFCPPCPVLEDPPKGSVSIETNGAITLATYTCVGGFSIAGDITRVCQDNNTWSGNTPSCTCETPTSPTNGAVTVSADGTTATYTCIANYTLTGDASRTCQTATNTWTGSDPMCRPCQTLDGIVDGDVTVTLSQANTVSVAFYTCKAGGTLNGVTSRTCLTSGSWTDTKPTCSSCQALTSSLSGTVNVTTNGTLTRATLVCADGYTRIGVQEISCLADGAWDAEEPQCICNFPAPAANGGLSLTDGDTTAIYSCDSGYSISGPSIRKCQTDGTGWSETDPTCVPCSNLTSSEALQISISTNGTTSMATFTCDLSYSLNGESVLRCQDNGAWTAVTPSCTQCQTLSSPSSGTLAFTTNGTSTTAAFSCTTGTSLSGPAIVECNSDGTWSASSAACVTCETLGGLADGSYIVSSNGTTSAVTYSCATGYTITGSSQAFCLDNGTWSFVTQPFCSRDGASDTVITEKDDSLLAAVITLGVLLVILSVLFAFATYSYYKLKKSGQLKGYTMRDDDYPKSIPIAAVPPSAAPIDHQKPLFEGGRATALSTAPDSHRQNSSRNLLSANSRSTTASISRLNLEMIRESTSSSVYGSGVPAPWSNKGVTFSESTDSPRQESPTLSSLYSSFSSPRRGYSQTPRYLSDTDDSTRTTPHVHVEEDVYRNTPSPRKSPKKRKKALHKLAHSDIEGTEYIPSYMKSTKSSANKTYQDFMLNENKTSAKTSLSVLGTEREATNSGRSTPKLTSPRV